MANLKEKRLLDEKILQDNILSKEYTGVWLFVAKEEDRGSKWLDQLKKNDVIPWRHGTDQYTNIMKPGDTAVIYRSSKEHGHQIHGIGTIMAVRQPFILDTSQRVQRLPIIFLYDFRDNPINFDRIVEASGESTIKGQGSVFPIFENTLQVLSDFITGNENIHLPLNVDDCSKAVGRTNFMTAIDRPYKNLMLFKEYITAHARRKMEDSQIPAQDVSAAQAKDLINAAWKQADRPPPYQDQIRADCYSVSDDPETNDENDMLNRKQMATILAIRLRRVYENANPAGKNTNGDVAPFTVLVDAPWGGGKSTFANFLAHQLEQGSDNNLPWNIATINAWKYQSVEPIWWVIYQSIRQSFYRDAYSKNKRFLQRPINTLNQIRLRISEGIWRLSTPRNILSLSAIIVSSFIAYFLLGSMGIEINSKGVDFNKYNSDAGSVKGITAILAILGPLASIRFFVISIGNSLLPGSPSAAKNYALGGNDPLDRFRKHFHATLENTNKPVLLIVDDIDRCKPDFVTDLIQGLQTVLRSSRLIVLILGERGWVEKCFANQFHEMADADDKKGERLGRKFVEKALQMSLTLPVPTSEQLHNLFEKALDADMLQHSGADTSPHSITRNRLNLPDQIEEKPEENTLIPTIPLKIENEKRWEEAVAFTQDASSDVSLEHALLPIASLLPKNPRQVKRIVNTISFYQAVAHGLGKVSPDTDEWRKLAVWIIIMMTKWNAWKALTNKPELLEVINSNEQSNKSDEATHKIINDMVLKKLLNIDIENQMVRDQSAFDLWVNLKIEKSDISLFREIIPALG